MRFFASSNGDLYGEKKSNPDKANEMFRAVSKLHRIILKALANYNLCLFDMDSGQYLKARTRAYKTIALAGAIASDYSGLSIWSETASSSLLRRLQGRFYLCLTPTNFRGNCGTAEEKDPLTGLTKLSCKKF